jgi:ABC-type transport system involved in multi-copper enzyme maturation permease subunit
MEVKPANTPSSAREDEKSNPAKSREVWNNPILWREVRTRAYGKRAFIVRLCYVVLFAVAAWAVHQHLSTLDLTFYEENAGALLFSMKIFVPMALLALILVNAQAVTAITGERDGRAIDLLLVTDLSPKEIVFGKLGGVFWNTREIVILPLIYLFYLGFMNVASPEITFYLAAGLCVLFLFAAMLGIHSGMTYAGSRSAIGVSLGTLFFLFVGVAVCLRMMLSMGGSFHAQLQPFLAFMAGGGLAMFLALGARNPSSAIGLASFGCPFATFYAMSALMMNYTLGVFLVVAVMYGFTTAAMLIPAISEFDIAVHHGTSE